MQAYACLGGLFGCGCISAVCTVLEHVFERREQVLLIALCRCGGCDWLVVGWWAVGLVLF